jgi:Ser/Thr protein kinase RdoA (MazF antagonist)
LAPWSRQQVRLSPCHGDPWHDNLLFSGDELTGLVDYGAARVDDPAADLARLLGSLAGNDRQAWAEGMAAYAAVRPLPADAGPYLAALDETGVVLAAANWLRWLYHEGRPVTDQPATVRRLAELVRRLEARGDVRGRPDFFS